MINKILTSKTNFINSNTNFKSNEVSKPEENKQISSLSSNVAIDYNVKVPQAFTKLGVEKLSNGQEIHCYKLANGQKVMITPMPSPKTYVNTYVNTGAMNEKDSERGISHFTEHMAFNGTNGTDGYKKLGVGDVFRKVAQMGGETNASTGMAETNYTIGIPQFNNEDLEEAISIQASMMNNLSMPDEMVEKEHFPVSSEINMYSDYMDAKANNIATKQLYQVGSTSEDLVAGRVDNIQNIDRTKVFDYYKNNYYPANMTTVITGDVNPDEAILLVAKHFRGENKPNLDRKFEKMTPIQSSVRKDVFSNKAVQTNATLAFNGPENSNIKDQVALDIALSALLFKSNSRIGTSLKDINVSVNPSVNKVSTLPTDGMAITLDIETSEENSEKTLKNIFTELQNFRIKGEDELNQIKDSIKSRHQDNYENPDRLNYIIGSGSLKYGLKNVVNEDSIIESITTQDVENAVKKYLDTTKASIAVVHPASENAESLNANYQKVNTTNSNISFKGGVHNAPPLNMNSISSYKLENNYEVAFIDTPKNTNAKSKITYSPNKNIQYKAGTDILLANILNNSTQNKNNSMLGDYFDKNNISSEINVLKGGIIEITGKMPSKNTQQFINIVQEQLMTPNFNIETFEEQKKLVQEAFSHNEPSAQEGINKAMYGETPLGYTSKEIASSLDNITLDDVKSLYSEIMSNSRATVVIGAPMSDRTVLNSTLSSFAKMPMVQPNTFKLIELHKPQTESKVILDSAPNSQANIIQAYSFKETGNLKDSVALSLMNQILSKGDKTGLFNNLREKEKLAYAVYSGYSKDENNSSIQCNILTTTDNPDTGEHPYDNIQKSIKGFTAQIEKMKNGEFEDSELEVVKKEFKDAIKTNSYTQQGATLALDLGMNNAYGVGYRNEQFNTIDTITREDIQNAAKYAFANKPIYSIVASENTLNANKEFFGSL